MSGAWVFVCGPSGAGKDSVIAWVRERLAGHSRVVFARRMVTRPAPPGPDHEPVRPDDFDILLRRGQLAWHWHAHGFGYAIARRYARQVSWGRIVVVNGSREHVRHVGPAPQIHRVLVDAPADQLARRLLLRGRDEPESIAQRMRRNADLAGLAAEIVISNDGELARAGARLLDFLRNLAADSPVPDPTCEVRYAPRY